MDFQELLQRASTNQSFAEKKHEKQRLEKQKEEAVVKGKQELIKKKAAAKLKEMNEKRHKEHLKYKGITGQPIQQGHRASSPGTSGKHGTQSPHQSKQHVKRDKVEGPVRTSKNDKVESAKFVQKKDSMVKDSKGDSSKHRNGGVSKGNGPRQGSSKGITSSSVKSTGGNKLSSMPKSKSTNFQDLMKLAQQNSKNFGSKEKDSGSSGKFLTVPSADSAALLRGKSPVGKVKTASRDSSPSRPGKVKTASKDSSPSRPGRVKTGSRGSSPLRPGKVKTSSRSTSPVRARTGKGKVTSRDNSPRPLTRPPPVKTTSKSLAVTSPKNLSTSKLSRNSLQAGKVLGERAKSSKLQNAGLQVKRGCDDRLLDEITGTDSPLTRRPLRSVGGTPVKASGRPRLKPAAKSHRGGGGNVSQRPVNASAFYGAAAANILRQGRKPQSSLSGHYTSTWVDEMSEYLQSNQLELEEEEDSDLDGFVASDEEFLDDAEEVNDYSSEIRKIFGYDRRKFDDDAFDDTVMESSFAQQEFEEKRSALIGQKEDDEDLARERATLKRKKYSHKPSMKQAKLSFH